MAFKFPYGAMQQLNLDWFIKQFQKLRADWATAEENIAGSLQDEIDRAEDALSDVFAARDTAVAAKDDAVQAKADALQASANAAQYWQNAANSASSAAGSAGTALQAAEDAETAETNAAASNTQSGVNKFMAEAWAVGTMNGTPVGSGTIQYNNNAKYYAQQASGDAAQTALDRAAVRQDKDDTDTIKDNANAAALRAEGWADGTQNGTPVTSESPYYENNAKYYKEAAEDVLESIPPDYTELADEVASQSEKFSKYVGSYSDNLYDYTKDTKGKVINSSGAIVDNDTYKISDFIYIGEGNTFTFNTMYPSPSNRIGVNNIAYYNASKAFVTRVNVNTSESSKTITMASGRVYVRFNILIDTPDFMVNLGTTLEDYKPYFDYSELLNDFVQKLINDKEIGFDKTKRINFTRDISDRYSFSGTTPTHNFDATTVTTAQMYSLYDAVMEDNSDFITMEEIGTASDNQKLRAYTLKSDLPVSANNRRRIKCLITCGTHGWEKSSTETMLMFMQEVCGRWKENAFYESFIRDVELIIIPVVNPYGFDNDIRKNANGVDLNRNFPVDWGRFPTTETDVDYAGTEALSEPESQAIYAYLQTLTDKLDFAFDFHEFGKANGRATWVETIKGTTRMGQLAQLYEGIVFDLITTKYSVLENADFETLVECSDSYGNGRISATLAQFADYSCTYEVAGEMPLDPTSTSSQTIQRFTDNHVKLCLDLFINFFCVLLRESAENSKQILS